VPENEKCFGIGGNIPFFLKTESSQLIEFSIETCAEAQHSTRVRYLPKTNKFALVVKLFMHSFCTIKWEVSYPCGTE
jgi:hypothetical protein